MSWISHSLVGTVEVEGPLPTSDVPTLHAWFAEAAGSPMMGQKCPPPMICAAGKVGRHGRGSRQGAVLADVGQLMADLDAEFERLVRS